MPLPPLAEAATLHCGASLDTNTKILNKNTLRLIYICTYRNIYEVMKVWTNEALRFKHRGVIVYEFK